MSRKSKGKGGRTTRPERKAAAKRSGTPPVWAIGGVAGLALVIVIVVVAITQLSKGGSESVATTGGPTVAAVSMVKGPADAPVKIVEYADFQCPFCARFALTTAHEIERDYIAKGLVSLEFRNFPFLGGRGSESPISNQASFGDESLQAAEAATCANDQGKFWEYHDKLFTSQNGENKGAFRIEALKQFASELGLDRTAFDSCLDGHKYERDVIQQREEGKKKGVQSTPWFFVNDQVIKGAQSYDVFKRAIEAELAKTRQ